MNRIQYLLKKNTPLILTMVASGGVIITTILAVKATPKASEILKSKEEEKGEKLTVIEKIRYGIIPYRYCIISCAATISCIASIQYLNKKNQASLLSAYTLLENSYNQYRDNIKKLCSDDVDFLARQEIVKAKYDPELDVPENDEELLFFDYQGMRFFWSSFHNVIRAEHQLLEALCTRGYACLNEYYDYLGIPRLDYGYQMGWSDIESCDPYNVKSLDFNYEETYVGDNKDIKCWIITTNMPAAFDYIL